MKWNPPPANSEDVTPTGAARFHPPPWLRGLAIGAAVGLALWVLTGGRLLFFILPMFVGVSWFGRRREPSVEVRNR